MQKRIKYFFKKNIFYFYKKYLISSMVNFFIFFLLKLNNETKIYYTK